MSVVSSGQQPTAFSQLLPTAPAPMPPSRPPPPTAGHSVLKTTRPPTVSVIVSSSGPASTTSSQSAAKQPPLIKVPTVKSDYKRLSEEVEANQQSLCDVLGRELLDAMHKDLETALGQKAGTIPNPRYMSAYYNLANAMLFTTGKQQIYFPLTNAALEAKKIRTLKEFVDQNPAIREILEGSCVKEYRDFLTLVGKVESSQLNFVITDVSESVVAYHRVRNVALRDVLRHLEQVYTIMVVVSVPSNNPYFKTYEADQKTLAELCRLPHSLKVQKIEEMGFDFGFLSRICNYWKKYRIEGTENCTQELPVPTNLKQKGSSLLCQMCSHPADNLDELICHYGGVHMAAKIIERFGETNTNQRGRQGFYKVGCKLCNILFVQEVQLAEHVALTHNVVKLRVQAAPTAFPCNLCALSFDFKVNLFEHYRVAHGQNKTLTEMNAFRKEAVIQCSRCPFKGSLQNIKFHSLEQHFFSQVISVISDSVRMNSKCCYCQHAMTGSQADNVAHYAISHNVVLRFITVGPEVTFEASCELASGDNNVFVVAEPEGAGEELHAADDADPLDPLAMPTEPAVMIKAEPGDSDRAQDADTIIILDDGSTESSGGSKSIKKQDTLKVCPFCHKKILSSKYVSHVALTHICLDIKREITRQQTMKNMPTFRCPDCPEMFKGQPLNHLVVHFAGKHSKIFMERAGGGVGLETSRVAEPMARQRQILPEASDTEENVDDPDYSPEVDHELPAATPVAKVSTWVEKFCTFCKENQARYPEAKQFLNSQMSILGPNILDLFLNQLTNTVANIGLLHDVVRELEAVSSIALASLPTVRRHLLLVDYMKKCEQEKSNVSQINPMHIVIFLSQLLGRPEVEKPDLHWLLVRISRLHVHVDGRPVGLCKKITDFFEVIQSPVDTKTLDFQFDKNAKRCRRCELSFSTYKDLNAHVASGECSLTEVAVLTAKPPAAVAPKSTQRRQSSDSSDYEIYIPKDTGTRTAAGAVTLPCSLCSFTFKTESVRALHMAQVHPSFNCDECGKVFTSRIGLKIHVKHAHMAGGLLANNTDADHLRTQLKSSMEKMGFSYETTSKIFQLSSPGQGEFSVAKIKSYLEAEDDDLGPHVGRWLDHVDRYQQEYQNPELAVDMDAAELDRLRQRTRALSSQLGFNSTQMTQKINREVGGGAPIKEWEYVYFEASRKLPKVNEMRIFTVIRKFCENYPDAEVGASKATATPKMPVKSAGTTSQKVTEKDDEPSEDTAGWFEQAERLKACRKLRNLTHDDVAQEINSRYAPAKPINGKLVWNVEKMKDGAYRRQVWSFVVRWLEEEETKAMTTKVQKEDKVEEEITDEALTQLSNELRTIRYRVGLSQDELALQINNTLAPTCHFSKRIISQVGHTVDEKPFRQWAGFQSF